MSLATTAAILFIFVSTVRIGPFRTALIMNLEPLTATVMSALVLGEVITPIQGGSAAPSCWRRWSHSNCGDDANFRSDFCCRNFQRCTFVGCGTGKNRIE